MKDEKKTELFDAMLRAFDEWREHTGWKTRAEYEAAAKEYAAYTGCSLAHAYEIPWMD